MWDGGHGRAEQTRGARIRRLVRELSHGEPDGESGRACAGWRRLPDQMERIDGGRLFELVRTTMPQDGPGSLSPASTADVLAFMLNRNKFPGGKTELPADLDGLKTIRIDPSKKH